MIDDTLLEYVTRLEQQVSRLKETLYWYAETRHMDYSVGHPSGAYLRVEQGDRARKCLEELANDQT